MIIYKKLRGIFGTYGLPKGRNPTLVVMDAINEKIFSELQAYLGDLAGSLEVVKQFPGNPVPEIIILSMQRRYFNHVMPEIEKLLNQDPEKVANVFPVLQPLLTKKSGELRDYYLNVASWRLMTEEAKMLKDELVKAGFYAMIFSVIVIGPNAIQVYEKIKSISEKIDKVYAASGFILETWNFCTLRTECLEFFILTNRAIAGGSVTSELELNFITPAYAQEYNGTPESAPPTLITVSSDDLQLQNSRIPFQALERLTSNVVQFQQWEWNYDATMLRLFAQSAKTSKNYMREQAIFDERFEYLLMIASMSDDNPISGDSAAKWQAAVKELITAGTGVDKAASKLYKDGTALPSPDTYDEPVTIKQLKKLAKMETTSDSSRFSFMWIVYGFILFVVIGGSVVVILLFYKRRSVPAASTVQATAETTQRAVKHAVAGSVSQPAAQPAYYLLLSTGGEYLLQYSQYSIGSGPGANIQITGAGVKPVHAVIKYSNEHNMWWVYSPDEQADILVEGENGTSFWLYPDTSFTIGSISAKIVVH
ncbi:MAG: hypothetical protein A2Y62_20850 [Candidatus Fischerbacteria bacterium RBG_13_37_8]|uniref:FHA domain-containing protein n=1 Tax=Candidatus Fischerbacteria bacterium RBG_13_37_8 TaxID=1817863 RepID=A0A1F5VEV4_9BACT|nr:MAG: hypothetical protein A2Y62_20850 [Candidatus Fischerbacteria bacterium RBG_13_37_8]